MFPEVAAVTVALRTDRRTDVPSYRVATAHLKRLKFPVNCSGPTVPSITFHCNIGIVTSYRLTIKFFVIEYHRGGNSIAELVQPAGFLHPCSLAALLLASLHLAGLSVEPLHNGQKQYEIDLLSTGPFAPPFARNTLSFASHCSLLSHAPLRYTALIRFLTCSLTHSLGSSWDKDLCL